MRLKQAFAIALASTIISCSTAPVIPQKPIEQIIAENIITPMDLTGVIYKLTKEEGIRQLSSLAMNNKYEDIWFYLPETGEWLDYGTDVSREGCNPEPSVLLKLRPNVKEVSSYHIHPACNLSMGGFYSSEYKNFQGVLPPSKEDLTYLLEEKAVLEKSGVKMNQVVVVDFGGYWTVNFENVNNKGLESYENLLDSHIAKYYSAYKSNKNDLKQFEVLKKELIKDFEKKAAELGLDLKYSFL
ncbi:MAG: hypothetical protein Q8O03_08005 [Nanoarchaeota archaeon]|nr:hypothetical protein [Nanoarchaeota archaeon]